MPPSQFIPDVVDNWPRHLQRIPVKWDQSQLTPETGKG